MHHTKQSQNGHVIMWLMKSSSHDVALQWLGPWLLRDCCSFSGSDRVWGAPGPEPELRLSHVSFRDCWSSEIKMELFCISQDQRETHCLWSFSSILRELWCVLRSLQQRVMESFQRVNEVSQREENFNLAPEWCNQREQREVEAEIKF